MFGFIQQASFEPQKKMFQKLSSRLLALNYVDFDHLIALKHERILIIMVDNNLIEVIFGFLILK